MRSISPTIPATTGKGKWHAPLTQGALLLALLFLAACADTGVRNTGRTFRTVVVDAGHGGHDAGTRSSRLILEKDAALSVAQGVNDRLRAAGFNTVMTRKGDYFVTLDDRVRISNREDNAIFVSVHFNEARPKPGIHGVETYYKSPQSTELAERLLRHVAAVPGEQGRGIHTARFHVLRLNRNPAVLVECAYLSNGGDASRAANPAWRAQVAGAIADGIIEQRRQ